MSKHDQFLINLLKQFLSLDSSQVTENEMLEIEWNHILYQGTLHRILPIVYHEIVDSRLAHLLNANFLKLLRIFSEKAAETDMKFQQEASSISEMLLEHDINAVIMKGPLNSLLLYPRSGCRIYEDLDILVSKSQLKAVKSILEKCGYQQGIVEIGSQIFKKADRGEIVLKELHTHETVEFHRLDHHRPSEISIDVNHSLSWKGHRDYPGFPEFTASAFLERKQWHSHNDLAILGPAVEELLLYLILHLYNEAVFFCWQVCWQYNFGDIQLIKYVDVILACQRIEDWDCVHSLILRYQIKEPVQYVITCIVELFGDTAVPNELKKYITDIHLVDYYYNKLGEKLYWSTAWTQRIFNQKLRLEDALDHNSKEGIL
ncbi:nucleotidyltransferase family protein [Paenibacillus sp. S150]|uniref:nucleotidyltransferase family protein n=1 Tax=Paenibacillus sp. S150 TaxID=2749826 RepID=UPI001C592F07|nr:nucleotidyltransferase family protein [Paenibacillus sp. S150]MBW4085031.1 nucleotidyltransferase family protein [Paenibacillus sp. S150]